MQNEMPPVARTIVITCPVRSTTITYPKEKGNPEAGNVIAPVDSPCTKGQCAWWNVPKQKCCVVALAEAMLK